MRTWMRSLALLPAALLACSHGPAPAGLLAPRAAPLSFTILHTNDFHGQLEPSGSNPGAARLAAEASAIRASARGDVLLVDAGDEMQGSLLSNLHRGATTIDALDAMAYDAATLGNHDFDWGQAVLAERAAQARYPFVSANVVLGRCADGSWTPPPFARPYVVRTLPNGVRVALTGVTTPTTPAITLAGNTAGLCFRDPAQAILHYAAELSAQADVVVVLSHLGYADGPTAYGDLTLARKLIEAGSPVPLIVGGHSHTDLAAAGVVEVEGRIGRTTVVQAHYDGRQLGRADLTFDPATRSVTVAWRKIQVSPAGAADPAVERVVAVASADPAYRARIHAPVAWVQTDLARSHEGDSMMGEFVDDAVYGALNEDGDPANDVDLVLNNPGGLRADWCARPDPVTVTTWSGSSADCHPGRPWPSPPMLLDYGQMFLVLPFGNATVTGTLSGAALLELLGQGARPGKGALQPAGLRYRLGARAEGRGAASAVVEACVVDRRSGRCEPVDPERSYRVGTNEFLAGGGDGFAAFRRMTDVRTWGDMLTLVNAWLAARYPRAAPYRGPKGDGTLDGRIARAPARATEPGGGDPR